jgi:hypothetical protein
MKFLTSMNKKNPEILKTQSAVALSYTGQLQEVNSSLLVTKATALRKEPLTRNFHVV